MSLGKSQAQDVVKSVGKKDIGFIAVMGKIYDCTE